MIKYNLYCVTTTKNGKYVSYRVFVTQKSFVEWVICQSGALTPSDRGCIVKLEINILYDIECSQVTYELIKRAFGDIND